jgi:hypothetical protein
MRLSISIAMLIVVTLFAGCISIKPSTPVKQNGLEQGVAVMRELPKKLLPGRATLVPDSRYVFILPDSAATLLVPLPFIGDAVVDQVHQHTSASYKNKFTAVDPYNYAVKSLQNTSFYKPENPVYKLYPYVVVQEGFDNVYRVSLVYHLEGDNWVGRYLYHLPTTYPKAEFVNTPPAEIQSLQKELAEGADVLLKLMQRDEAGTLVSNGKKATLGSLFIVGSKIVGLVSPTALAYPNTEIVDEGQDYVIARGAGDITSDGQSGAMLFGVHYFHKNQLHTYKVTTK